MRSLSILAAIALAAPAAAQVPCGGDFAAFRDTMEAEAVSRGADPALARSFFAGTRQNQDVLAADRRQGVFTLPFTDFARRLISQNRVDRGQAMSREYDATFERIQAEFGVPRGVLLAFWAFETDYGAVQGDFNTVDALMTLAHDCRRPDLFRPQVFAALELAAMGDLDPRATTGAWAGEIGQVQMLPRDILENGIDGDGDGHVRLKTSAPDALMSGGSMLSALGWRPNEPWLQEVVVPANMDWSRAHLENRHSPAEWAAMGVAPRSGAWAAELPSSLVLPQGKDGPAFVGYPNFDVFFEWNQSFTYVLTAAYFATRLEGAPVFAPGNPSPALSDAEMRSLQTRLNAMGHDVGEIDGILGAGTRSAVRAEQARLGLPADGWPTRDLLARL
ncbi:lytic murein transglycosylase [Palleronia aestuarii]|uniref:Lytic murein transglycosylase n=1 Tax=Palleronia aestuarii TaxID=568105 RepID=A0A2W7NFT7_9RHOB|nr:lytic murein transglycosylase [Palleronia aestuarii]PZX19088.1 lytic murein transglycosylase [Palleronia aestuarii]